MIYKMQKKKKKRKRKKCEKLLIYETAVIAGKNCSLTLLNKTVIRSNDMFSKLKLRWLL